MQIHLLPANLTRAYCNSLKSHKLVSANFNSFKIRWYVSLQALQNRTPILLYYLKIVKTILVSNQRIAYKFCHIQNTKQINNPVLHIYNSLSFPSHSVSTRSSDSFPFHMTDHHLAIDFLWSVHDSGIHSLLIPETRDLYQYSVTGSKHTSSKLRSLPRLFPISLDCLVSTWILIFAIFILCPIEWHFLVLVTGQYKFIIIILYIKEDLCVCVSV